MLYVNAVDWCTKFTTAETVRHIPGRLYMGGTFEFAAESQGWLTAMDALTGAVKWKYQLKECVKQTGQHCPSSTENFDLHREAVPREALGEDVFAAICEVRPSD